MSTPEEKQDRMEARHNVEAIKTMLSATQYVFNPSYGPEAVENNRLLQELRGLLMKGLEELAEKGAQLLYRVETEAFTKESP